MFMRDWINFQMRKPFSPSLLVLPAFLEIVNFWCSEEMCLLRYGCPSIEEIELFSRQYKQQLDEIGAKGEIPDDLALEVSSPGADRLLRVPDDLWRFKDMPMVVSYLEHSDTRPMDKTGIYFLDSIEAESRCCIWKLADVRENWDPAAKGRPLNRKQKDARLRIPYSMIHKVTLYISY